MNKTVKIEINFPVPIEFPPGFERALEALTNMVCEAYEKDNPERVMWPAGGGSKPIWREPKEPDFDDSVYCIDVAEREDITGRNPNNPNREALQEKEAERRRQAREMKQGIRRGQMRSN